AVATAGTLTVQLGSGTATTLDLGGANITSSADLLTALNGITGITAAIDGTTGQLSITGSGGESVTVGGTKAAALGLTAGTATATRAAADGTTTTAANPKRAELLEQFNDLMDQIDQLAKDS